MTPSLSRAASDKRVPAPHPVLTQRPAVLVGGILFRVAAGHGAVI